MAFRMNSMGMALSKANKPNLLTKIKPTSGLVPSALSQPETHIGNRIRPEIDMPIGERLRPSSGAVEPSILSKIGEMLMRPQMQEALAQTGKALSGEGSLGDRAADIALGNVRRKSMSNLFDTAQSGGDITQADLSGLNPEDMQSAFDFGMAKDRFKLEELNSYFDRLMKEKLSDVYGAQATQASKDKYDTVEADGKIYAYNTANPKDRVELGKANQFAGGFKTFDLAIPGTNAKRKIAVLADGSTLEVGLSETGLPDKIDSATQRSMESSVLQFRGYLDKVEEALNADDPTGGEFRKFMESMDSDPLTGDTIYNVPKILDKIKGTEGGEKLIEDYYKELATVQRNYMSTGMTVAEQFKSAIEARDKSKTDKEEAINTDFEGTEHISTIPLRGTNYRIIKGLPKGATPHYRQDTGGVNKMGYEGKQYYWYKKGGEYFLSDVPYEEKKK